MVPLLGLLAACGPIAFNDSINLPFVAPEPEPEPEPESHAQLKGDRIEIDKMIQFEFDSANLESMSFPILDDVIKVLQENPQIELLDIVGHTSSEGSKRHNDKLSTDRAASVQQYLLDHGVDRGRLSSQGRGPSEPIADNETEAGRIANRRVEFRVMKVAEPEPGTATDISK
jgi:outer membrane protein OmpA-like peptidoglycan-associated protein